MRAPARFTIWARDSAGQPTMSGGERFRVVFRGRSAPQTTMLDKGDGSYECEYVVNVSGEYEMMVLLDGVREPAWPHWRSAPHAHAA